MSVKVIRKKERLTSQWTELEVYLDGEKKPTIYGSESSVFQLNEETGNLKVKQILSKSVERQVNEGDVVEVSNSPLITYSFFLMPVILILNFILLSVDLLDFWISGIVLAAYITFVLSVKPLQIKDITDEEQEPGVNQNENTA